MFVFVRPKGWCEDASNFFSEGGHSSKGFFRVRKGKRENKGRMEAIRQIQRHLNVSAEKWNKRSEVYIAKHHYRPDHIKYIEQNAKSGGITKFYDKSVLRHLQQPTLEADAFDGGKYIIPPSQAKEDVKHVMSNLNVVPSIQREGKISPDGRSLTFGGASLLPGIRSEARQKCRDVAAVVDMI